ncbi:MAG: hypothetical protein ACP5O8_00070 [Candidatus Aenigmatarchaeota archaeon]
MGIAEIYKKSLKDSLKFKRLFPFFALFSISSSISLFFLLPIVSVLPNLLTLKITQENVNTILLNFFSLFILFLITFILSCWFSGALIYDVWREEGFSAGLNYSRKLLAQVLSLAFILAFLNILLSSLSYAGVLLRLLTSFIFLFSPSLIIIKREDFLSSMKKSCEIVRKNLLSSFVFWFFLFLIYFLLLLISYFLTLLSISPVLLKIFSVYQLFSAYELSEEALVQMVGIITNSLENLVASLLIFSFFFSYSYVFLTTAETHYFLFLTRKKLISSRQS